MYTMKNISRTIVLLLFILLSYPFYGIAQTIKSFDFKGNFFYNTITSIEQDTLGFMWLGLDNGRLSLNELMAEENNHQKEKRRYPNLTT